MIKKILVVSIVALFAVSITSCREEKTTGDKIEDVVDDVEDAVD
jgi:predicted small secreted protein